MANKRKQSQVSKCLYPGCKMHGQSFCKLHWSYIPHEIKLMVHNNSSGAIEAAVNCLEKLESARRR